MAVQPDNAGDTLDELESVDDEEANVNVTQRILKYPEVLAALQSQRYAEMIASLPEPVKRRIKALKKLQLEATNIEAKFFMEVHALECKYSNYYHPLFEKRKSIVSGSYEPTDEEAQWTSDEEDEISKALKDKVKVDDATAKETKEAESEESVKGIPDFWFTILKNVNLLSEMVQEYDEPVLKYLSDITVRILEEPMGFVLEFHFEPNEYFTNTVLTKEYDMKCVPDEEDPFGFEGPEIYKCRGCTINWNKSKNVTLKTVKKKQKHKSRGLVRTITKTVPADSFFNFFSPPTNDLHDNEVDEGIRNILTADFEIGHYLRERLVPRAVLYYTGECIEEEDFDEEEEEEDEDEEEDSDGGKEGGNNKQRHNAPADQNCKQQ